MNAPLALVLLVLALLLAAPVQADPAWLAQAQALERRGDWQGLLAWGKRWTQAEAGNGLAWFVLGRALGELKRYPEAIQAYRQNLGVDPSDQYAYNNLGNALRATGRYREAMDAYRGAVRNDPHYILAWENLGLTFYQLKGPAGVTRALRALHASDPTLAQAWRQLAIDHTLNGDARATEGAIRILRALDDAERERMFEILLAQL